ncbi:MAG: SDR family NAD(P)-dependent oxidoreductase [Rhizobiaceae bacterium]
MDDGRNVLITGGTDGIGLLLVRHYLATGAKVIFTGRRSEEEIENHPEAAHYIQADQAKTDCAENILKTVKQAGWEKIDNLILNAGTGTVCDPVEEASGSILNTISVNLAGPITILRELAPFLEAGDRPAVVTFIGSTAIRGAPQFASYAASKAGLDAFARALASEWAGRVKVQIIHPGPIATQMHKKAQLNTGFARRFFINPDFAAERLVQMIDREKQRSFLPIGFREIAAGLTGKGPES